MALDKETKIILELCRDEEGFLDLIAEDLKTTEEEARKKVQELQKQGLVKQDPETDPDFWSITAAGTRALKG
ncbi:MAG: hypothetical protein ACE5FW_03350 [Candidatus Aenigmatarchaeota archaeon]